MVDNNDESNSIHISTLEIELLLFKELDFTQNLIVHNVTDVSGLVKFETDILLLNKSGYAIAFEIKISKNDLKNDLKKKHIKAANKVSSKSGVRGIDYYFGKLKYFNYVVPQVLIPDVLAQAPDFCGIYSVDKTIIKDKLSNRSTIKLKLKEIRKPKQLSNYKWNSIERYKLARLGTMRIKNLKENIFKLLSQK